MPPKTNGDLVFDLLEKHVHAEPDGENIKWEFSPLRHEIEEDITTLLTEKDREREEALKRQEQNLLFDFAQLTPNERHDVALRMLTPPDTHKTTANGTGVDNFTDTH